MKRKHLRTNGIPFKVGTFNCRGLRTDIKQKQLANDVRAYHLDALAVTETHLAAEGIKQIKSTNGHIYNFYNAGITDNNRSVGGVGIVIPLDTNAYFKRYSDRICSATINLPDNRKLLIISALAPTLPNSEKNPEKRENFYQELENVINGTSKRTILIIAGDFNAKTGTGYTQYSTNMGKHGKGELNNNGEYLLQLASRNELVLTNTLFQHKMTHRTTWTAPEKHVTPRTNPVRNQIDYIITRIAHRCFVQDARSYSGTEVYSDHKLVITKMNINWHRKSKQLSRRSKKLNLEKLSDIETRTKYKLSVEEKLANTQKTDEVFTPQEKWSNITKACKEASEEILGYHQKSNKCVIDTEDVQTLSRQQKELGKQVNAASTKEERQKLQKERNKKMREIHDTIKKHESNRLVKDIEEIENSKNDSTRMYKAIRKIYRNKPKQPLIVEKDEGVTCDEETATETITDYFKFMFNKENQTKMEEIKPTEMNTPFDEEEVAEAVNSLKNNKSAGIDDIHAEQLKYGPDIINKYIAEILNDIAKTGDYPEELKHGILVPLPKPGKKKGPVENLRPIILLSIVRKILAICLIRRINNKLNEHIPITQAAYRSGRSTTEHVFAVKIMAEKAISSTSYETTLLLLDMSKAFDTVKRNTLFEDLRHIVDEDELHMLSILIKDVHLQVRCGQTLGDIFTTNIGVPQGDCLSPVLFTLYLAKAMENNSDSNSNSDHTYCKQNVPTEDILPSHITDHNYTIKRDTNVLINQQYADDIGWITNAKHKTNQIKRTVPEKLKSRNLQVNQNKTEEHSIKRNGGEQWKKCKYLGTLLDTDEDIKRRKQLANVSFIQYKDILTSKKVELKIRLRLFNAYISSIFLYNSELWTLTKTKENQIDIFQRNLLRKILNIHWPHTISNEKLQDITRETNWSEVIKLRRLRWIGHLHRLPESTPAHQALVEALRPTKRPRGRPATTWISMVNNDLKELGLKLGDEELLNKTNKRLEWRTIILGGAVPNNGEERK